MTCLLDQASTLRALMQGGRRAVLDDAPPACRRASTIAVASGKGGVGKTTIAVNLAVALAQAGSEVVLLDGDAGLGNADILLGLAPGLHLGHVLDGRKTLDEVLARPMPHLRVLPAGPGIAWLADLGEEERRRLMDVIAPIGARADVILIDCAAGFGPLVLDLIDAAGRVLIVTTPEPTAIADAYALIKTCFRRSSSDGQDRLQLVVNQARSHAEAVAVHRRIAAVCERFLSISPPLAGWIADDPKVAEAVRARRPVLRASPRCPSAKLVRCLSESIMPAGVARARQRVGMTSPFGRWRLRPVVSD